MSDNHMEILWGVALLDEGYTSIPNLIIRNYRRLGIEHGEYGFLNQLLSYKHDTRDPYPSRETLANNMCCSERQIDKWVKSLRDKGFLRTGRRRNIHSKKWANTVYNFKPLLDAVHRLIGETPLPDAQTEYEIVWDDEPPVPEVRMGSVPEVRMGSVPQVRTKKKIKNNNLKNDCMIEDLNLDSEIFAENKQDEIYNALQQYAPKLCYIENNIPMGSEYVDEIYLMLIKQFPMRLSPEVVQIACNLYFDRSSEVLTGKGVVLKMDIKNPTGFFKTCYNDAINLYKRKHRHG